jgi:hypothetical protein
MKLEKDEIIVYWCPSESVIDQEAMSLLDMKPKPFMSDFLKKRKKEIVPYIGDKFGSGYHVCTALHELVNNTYIINSPVSVDVSLSDEGYVDRNSFGHNWFKERSQSFNNSLSFDFGVSYALFSEESLEVSLTPPYMHKCSQSNTGFLSSVKWDISSWFRPFIFIYHMWDGEKSMSFVENEPIGYFHFHTDKKIVFKEFKMNETITQQLMACTGHKNVVPWQKMNQLYLRFNRGMKKRVLLEIKKNLV